MPSLHDAHRPTSSAPADEAQPMCASHHRTRPCWVAVPSLPRQRADALAGTLGQRLIPMRTSPSQARLVPLSDPPTHLHRCASARALRSLLRSSSSLPVAPALSSLAALGRRLYSPTAQRCCAPLGCQGSAAARRAVPAYHFASASFVGTLDSRGGAVLHRA